MDEETNREVLAVVANLIYYIGATVYYCVDAIAVYSDGSVVRRDKAPAETKNVEAARLEMKAFYQKELKASRNKEIYRFVFFNQIVDRKFLVMNNGLDAVE